MPATPLPPSGDLPGGPKTCDASGMAEIHRLFTRGFGEGPELVRRVRRATPHMRTSSRRSSRRCRSGCTPTTKARTNVCGPRSTSVPPRAPRTSSG